MANKYVKEKGFDGKEINQQEMTQEQIYENMKKNFKYCMNTCGYMTQVNMADALEISTAKVSKFITGKTKIDLETMFKIKKLSGCNMDDFMFTDLSEKDELLDISEFVMEEVEEIEYIKFYGMYRIYYYDNSSFKGRERKEAADALKSGILFLCNDHKSPSDKHKAVAVFHMTKAEADLFYETMKEDIAKKLFTEKQFHSVYKHVTMLVDSPEWRVYVGSLNLTARHMYLQLQFKQKENTFVIFHRMDRKADEYMGGLGAMLSVSDGIHPSPCIQYLGLSKHTLNVSAESIGKHLLTNYPGVKTYDSIDKLIEMVEAFYGSLPEEQQEEQKGDCYDGKTEETRTAMKLEDEDKRLMIRFHLDKIVNSTLEKNLMRSNHVSEVDDDDWTHYIDSIRRL